MKTTALSILMILAVASLHAQDYLVSFAGTGASTNVDSVKVENLSQCTLLSLAGTDILNLTATVGIHEFGNQPSNPIRILPNPSPGHCSVEFELSSGNKVSLALYAMSGKEILQQSNFLPWGTHTFELDGIQKGIYLLKIQTDHCLYTAKLVSIGSAKGNPVSRNAESTRENGSQVNAGGTRELKDSRNTGSILSMQFNEGDTLKLTGKSGNFRTILMLFPKQSQTVTFHFVKCTDADSNNYAVVQVGSQLWMEENLKTTRYRDGSGIAKVTDSASWGSLATDAWCDFHNDPAEGAFYGHLYNYYAVADSRNLSPVGWHVASNAEWNIMEKFIDPTVDTTALGGTGNLIGRIMKEGCNTRWQYYDSTYGWNSAGFTALCSNYRIATGAWSQAPGNNHDDGFWTATSYNASSAWYRSLRWCFSDIYSLFPMKKAGQSVRCVKNQ